MFDPRSWRSSDRLCFCHDTNSATDRANAVGKEALQNLNYLAVRNTKQFEKVEMWAKMEELARGRLDRKVEEDYYYYISFYACRI